MKNHSQLSYAELLARLQEILQNVESGNSSPDQWDAQLAEVQVLIQECRQRLQRTEQTIQQTLTNL